MADNDELNVMTPDEIVAYEKEVEEEFEAEAEKLKIEKEDLKNSEIYTNYAGDDRVISSYQMQKYYERMGFKPDLYYSGLQIIDAMLGGWEESEVCTISGVTGNGKTLFCKTLTHYFPMMGIDCLWFTYEEIPRLFLTRFKSLPIFYLPKKHISHQLDWIEKRIIESKVKYKTKIIFIDHLHFLVPLKAYINQSILIGSIMREIKKIAIRQRIIIFLIAHTKMIKQEEKPDLANIRDSSFIAQESDKVLYVRRCGTLDEDGITFNQNTNLYVLKNRLTGKNGIIKMHFDEETGLLKEGEI
jgi:replicative DNA helicase